MALTSRRTLASACGLGPTDTFVDLGSGTGKLCLAVALAGLLGAHGEPLRVSGVELLAARHELLQAFEGRPVVGCEGKRHASGGWYEALSASLY